MIEIAAAPSIERRRLNLASGDQFVAAQAVIACVFKFLVDEDGAAAIE
jgi:hypothetical protein